MKWTISQLQKYRNKDFLIDETIRVDELTEIERTIREVSPIHVTGRVDFSYRKVTFHLHLKGYLILPCSRTLVDVKYPIDVQTTETFLLSDLDYEQEEEVYLVKGDVIDLMPVIIEILLLEVPMQVFSENVNDEDAAPQSGEDWEVIQEKTKKETVDPRLAELAKFFDQSDSSDK
ncbi:YceD family protein [Bacillus aquiflavi]|uniref:YceD family protein n=1 Tax=Bacillus aquiflavi TaxID=2672567 RepID=UPI001CA93965|nr:YceD family protein [Bacillus aquiflavi]UAC49292.1 YceD family protein [Bacillus aquiflavi]